jgi:ribonucleoside-diphosphate reductase alpha chain
MSFLKIGDRAAGAIKSGGTTRRAAKMVCLDIDHPDIEDFIDWKVIEEQKVAALVAGSKTACGSTSGHARCRLPAHESGEERFDADPRRTRPAQGVHARRARRMVPDAYIAAALQLAEQGAVRSSSRVRHRLGQRGLPHRLGPELQQLVRIPNSFFDAVERTTRLGALPPHDGKRRQDAPARELWDKVCYSAWSCADPGVQYDTTINEWHTCPEGGRINASNPCSEYMFLDDTACNLASLNLCKFPGDDGELFDVEAAFEHAVRLWTIVLEISVLMAQFPSEEIAQLSYEYRTLGLGYANLGTLLMRRGHAYDSPRAARSAARSAR